MNSLAGIEVQIFLCGTFVMSNLICRITNHGLRGIIAIALRAIVNDIIELLSLNYFGVRNLLKQQWGR